ncbi:MAG: hypothetical protein KZQ58_08980 [gamma proteobacterium symbiont of Bathyaustriella thionipta]|nr:hypothetical protein [gamma proteobacterium symbiont of Bathyaustriella thionipta]
MKSAVLLINIKSYWHAGSGRGSGAVLDAVVHQDSQGLPVLPGRHIKGLLRDALMRAADWEWDNYSGLAERLFGEATENRTIDAAPPSSSCLRVSDATLPEDVMAWLVSESGRDLRTHLYQSLYMTAINHETGVAEDKSLRGIEVTVPLALSATISLVAGQQAPKNWQQKIAKVLPLIHAVGAHRTRGLGRAELHLQEIES